MTQAPGAFTSRAYQMTSPSIDIGELVPIAVGEVTFDLNFLDDVESFSEYRDRILAYGTLLSELNPDPEDVEWDGSSGWSYVSDDPIVINEFAVLADGEVVQPDDFLEPYFVESVVQEVLNNPRRYPGVDGYDLAQSLLGQYEVSYDEQNGRGYFRRIQGDTAQAARVSTVNDEDDVDGTDY